MIWCKKAKQLIDIVRANPYQAPSRYEKLAEDFARDIRHRLEYQVYEEQKTVKMISL